MHWVLLGALAIGAGNSAQTTLIENVTIEKGDGTPPFAGVVKINNGQITCVGDQLKGCYPEADVVVDGKGKVLTPGLLETQTALGLMEVPLSGSDNDDRLPAKGNQGNIFERFMPAFRAGDGFNPASVRIPVARRQGITRAITRPRGGILHGTGGWFALSGGPEDIPNPNQPAALFSGVDDSARASYGTAPRGFYWLALRQAFEDARFYRKNQRNVDQGRSRDLVLHPTHLRALWPVLDRKLPLVLDIDRASDIHTAVHFADQQKIRLIIQGGGEAWKMAELLARTQTPVIIQPSSQAPYSFDSLASRDDAPAILHKAGVPLIISTGSGRSPGRLRQEAGIAVSYGLDRNAAMQAITQTPAEVFGRGKRLGTIEVGKQADLVLWSGDPLEVMTVAEQIWIDGRAQELTSRQTLLAKRYSKPTKPKTVQVAESN